MAVLILFHDIALSYERENRGNGEAVNTESPDPRFSLSPLPPFSIFIKGGVFSFTQELNY